MSDAADCRLDDVIYVDTDKSGGIIAGSNPLSVLIAVYEMLRQNGCRCLCPGLDGELVPNKELEPVKYRHLRYRYLHGMDLRGSLYRSQGEEALPRYD